jgi:hypothetical protein
MNNHKNSEGKPEYTVQVNPDVAFSMRYQDDRGVLFFSIEVGEDPGIIFLNQHPSDGLKMIPTSEGANKSRIALAIQRVAEYFESRGKLVKLE